MIFQLTADSRRHFLFLARLEQGKTACPSGKQFYILSDIDGSHNTLKSIPIFKGLEFFIAKRLTDFVRSGRPDKKRKVCDHLR
jgi:hypothetical protein